MIQFNKMSIAKKLIVSILTVSILGIAVMAVFIYNRSKSFQTATALESAGNLAGQYAKDVQNQLEIPMVAARTLAQCMEGFEAIEPGQRRNHYNHILKIMLEKNPEFIGIWSCWEPDALDGNDARYANTEGTDATGRFIPYWNRGSGKILVEPLLDYDKAGAGDYYQISLKTGKESIIDPYVYPRKKVQQVFI